MWGAGSNLAVKYYRTEEEFQYALAEALREEYLLSPRFPALHPWRDYIDEIFLVKRINQNVSALRLTRSLLLAAFRQTRLSIAVSGNDFFGEISYFGRHGTHGVGDGFPNFVFSGADLPRSPQVELRSMFMIDGQIDCEFDQLRGLGLQRAFFVLNIEQFHLLYHCPISFLKIILPLLWRSQRFIIPADLSLDLLFGSHDMHDLYKTIPE
jgi:hypothetical protein